MEGSRSQVGQEAGTENRALSLSRSGSGGGGAAPSAPVGGGGACGRFLWGFAQDRVIRGGGSQGFSKAARTIC